LFFLLLLLMLMGRFVVLFLFLFVFTWLFFSRSARAARPYPIQIDGVFNDWKLVPGYNDPEDTLTGSVEQDGVPDLHQSQPLGPCGSPRHV
jgi:hypothetical protein